MGSIEYFKNMREKMCEEYLKNIPKGSVAYYATLKEKSFYDEAIEALEQHPKTEQFAKWVATEIFDDYWEYNKDAFAEIACRKLAMLGIVKSNGGKWELVEPQESEDKK